MVLNAALLASALYATLATALNLSVSGDPEFGQAITLNWDGTSPWTLDILTAASGDDAFTLYKSFTPLTVNTGVWHVDVAAGTLVEFIVTDTTGDSGSQYLQIDDGGAAASTSSVASVSSASVQSTESVASQSSVSAASTSSIATTSTTSSTTSAATTTAAVSSPNTASLSRMITTHSPSAHTTSTPASPSTGVPVGTDLPSQSGHSSGPKAGAVAGGVIGTILGLMVLAAIYWLCRRQRQRQRAEAYGYPDHGSNATNEKDGFANHNFGHRRTLSRGQPHAVNWNPEQPHLTPTVNSTGGQDFFAATAAKRDEPRPSSALREFGEFITTPSAIPTNSLSLDFTPAPAPAPAPAAARPSVLDLARNAPKNDIPLYTPTSMQRPTFGQDQPAAPHSDKGDSPFADKFAVHGRYEPDLQDPAVNATYANATGAQAPLSPPPRPARPERPSGLGLDGAAAAVVATPTPAARHRNSVSQPGPVPTVGHSRKISGPIPIVFPNAHQDDRIPSWAFDNEGSRYPTITVQSPSTASTASGMAGVGAGGAALTRSMSGSVGRPIYPVAAMGPMSPPRHQQKRSTSTPQPQPPRPTPRSPPTGPRSPPSTLRSPPVGPRSPPTISRAQVASPPPLALSPLTPPRRITAEPDVPTTPTTPNLSAFPTPPRTLTTAGSLTSVDSRMSSQQEASTGAVGDSPSFGKGRSLQPITTTLPYPPNGALSPIAASPIPTPLASSNIASPTVSRFTPGLTRDNTISSQVTTSTTERMNTIIRRELQQGVRSGANTAPQTPFTSGFQPNGPTNYQPPMPNLPSSFSPTFKSPIQQSTAADGWFDGRHISLAPTTVSGRPSSTGSARRLSDITSGDAEWKELESQLKWLNDEAHVMPRSVPQPPTTGSS